MKLNDTWEAVKEQGVRILKYAFPARLPHTQLRAQSVDRRTHRVTQTAIHENPVAPLTEADGACGKAHQDLDVLLACHTPGVG